MARPLIRTILLALIATLVLGPTSALAGGPARSHAAFTYTLADAIADYLAFGENAGDCGDFVLLVDFHVERDVAVWADRETRHVQYTGNVYSSADPSRSIPRNGNFEITFWLDGDGAPTGITRSGVIEYVIVDGHRIVTSVGHDVFSFATGPISGTPHAGSTLADVACDALR
jgi:hypothetical protein